MMRKNENIIQIVKKEDYEIEDNQQNTQQQLNQQNQLTQQPQQYKPAQSKQSDNENKEITVESDHVIELQQQTLNPQIHNQQQVLNPKIETKAQPQHQSNIQETQKYTKSSNQLIQMMKNQPEFEKIEHPYVPQKLNEFQKFKMYRDGLNQVNIASSSEENASSANSGDYKKAFDEATQGDQYGLKNIVKTKSYCNDQIQNIISYQQLSIESAQTQKFIMGATLKPIKSDIKEQYLENFKRLISQAQEATQNKADSIACDCQKVNNLQQ
ncbi:hypothetical protein ABPG72_021348 [Tetrahymena utriculariae]